jgi:hypothetical protein
MAKNVLTLGGGSDSFRHNVAPTYNQPVIRQIGDRQNERAENAAGPSDDNSGSSSAAPSSPKPSMAVTAQSGDLIVQSMRLSSTKSIDVDGDLFRFGRNDRRVTLTPQRQSTLEMTRSLRLEACGVHSRDEIVA